MGSFLKKTLGVIKVIFLFIIENWAAITPYISGITITGILAGLSKFIHSLSYFLKFPIRFNIPLWLVIIVLPIALHIIYIYVLNMINKFKKPAYLKFTSMEYKDMKDKLHKIKWDYELDNKKGDNSHKKYVVRNIRDFCRDCGCELIPLNDSNYTFCPICRNNVYDKFDEYDAVIKTIWHRIENRLF